MTVDEALIKLKALSLHKQGNKGFSMQDRAFIENYSILISGRPFRRTSCGNCYADKAIELYTILIKTKTFIMSERIFKVRPGDVVITPGVKSILSGAYPVSEIEALEHLSKFPNKIKQFSQYPDNYLEMIDQFKNGTYGLKKENKLEENESIDKKEFDDNFLAIIVNEINEGKTDKEILSAYKKYELNGKKLTQKELKSYIEVAKN